MKLLFPSRRMANHGGTLAVALLVTLMLGLVLAGYLTLTRSVYVSTARSQAWNQALVLAEAGVEEALAQLNPGALTTSVAAGNGWHKFDGFLRPEPPERALLGGSYAVVYSDANPPTIYATGYTTFAGGSVSLSRAVRVVTTNAPLFVSGLQVERITNPAQWQYYLDRYNSGDPNYNRDGNYDPARVRAPRTTNAAVTARFELPDVLPPYETAVPLPTKAGRAYELSGDYFVNGNLYLSDEEIRVAAGRSATLYIKGSLSMHADAELTIEQGGSLRVFVAGSTARISQVDNRGAPEGFQYYGLPGNTAVLLRQPSGSLVGTIYAPAATFLWPGSDTPADCMGALVVRDLVLSRPLHFHFDESLAARGGPRRGYAARSWEEL